MATPDESFWYCFGPQGETRQLVNAGGNVVDSYAFDPYGNPVSATGSDPNPFQFGGSVGYYTDPAAPNLILCGQRWYSPPYGRWLSRDPIGYAGGENLYEYCGDDPINGLDPVGLAKGLTDGDELALGPTTGIASDPEYHPGMHAGTAQSNAARSMLSGVITTAVTLPLGFVGGPEAEAAGADLVGSAEGAEAVGGDAVAGGSWRGRRHRGGRSERVHRETD